MVTFRFTKLYTTILVLFSATTFAVPSVDDVFDVIMTGDGSCAPYRTDSGNGLIDRMFKDVQEIVYDTNQVVSSDYTIEWSAGLRNLAWSMFGITPNGNQALTEGSIDAAKLASMKGRYN